MASGSFQHKATFYNGNEDHRAIIRYISGDLRQRAFTDFARYSESRFANLWILDRFCAMVD